MTALPDRSPPSRPLVVSSDEDLLDDVLRLLAAAGCEPEVAAGGPALRRAHRHAPLVLLGADALGTGPVRALPRRPGVVLVSRGELPAADWAAAVELGVERVAVLPSDESWLLTRAAGAIRRPVPRGWLVVVGAGCGGAGASTLATAVALTAAGGDGDVLLVDADPAAGGLDLLLGAEDEPGLRWPELAGLRGRVPGESVVGSLPEVSGLRLLSASRDHRHPVPAEALGAVVDGARAAGCSVVVDLPRTAAGAEAVLAEADLAVLLVPARLRAACAARAQVLAGVDGVPAWSAAHLVVRRVPGGLPTQEVAGVVGRPVLAELPHDRSAAARAERGQPPGVGPRSAFGPVSRRLLAELAQTPVVPEPTP